MSGKLLRGAATLAAAVCLSVAPTWAALPATLAFETDFAFMAAGQEMAAGRYQLLAVPGNGSLTLRNAATGMSVLIRPVTTLAEADVSQPEVVFDRVGTTHYLAEVRIPGTDGVAFQGAAAEHRHVRLKATR